jgi:hypothetical protein
MLFESLLMTQQRFENVRPKTNVANVSNNACALHCLLSHPEALVISAQAVDERPGVYVDGSDPRLPIQVDRRVEIGRHCWPWQDFHIYAAEDILLR